MARLVWKCDACGKTIRDGGGYVEVDRDLAFKQLHEQRARARGDGPVRLSDIPPWAPVHWTVHHDRCNPNADDGTCYSIEVDRIRSVEQLLQWNVHMAQKNWIHETDWFELLQHRFAPYHKPTVV